MVRRRLVTTVRLLVAVLLGTLSLVVVAPTATAAVEEGIGHKTTPGQSWGGRDRAYDWLGSYTVRGEQVFCVSFALKAPDSEETYEPGDELLTKWGDPLADDVAANISYLLLRYGDTTEPDEAAALAHLLHSWTAAPRSDADLDPAKPFTEIGYDVDAQFAKLPTGAQKAVKRLRADAEANRGPWNAAVTAPEDEQFVDVAAEWSVSVTNAEGAGVEGIEVTLNLSDLVVEEDTDESGSETTTEDARTDPASATEDAAGETTGEATDSESTDEPGPTEITVTTDDTGTARIDAVPTGENPTVTATMTAPAERPYVRDPVRADTQRVVSTGGEQELTAEATTTATPSRGAVQVTKVDKATGEGIAGVPLRLTAEDRTSPAVDTDGEDLVGADGKPVVVTTEGDDGLVTIEDLKTPQKVCVVEVSPPNGYADAFDPDDPPSVCGELTPGGTLELTLTNVADQVPHTIPAGDRGATVTHAATAASSTSLGALGALGALSVLVAGLAGWAVRKRLLSNR